MAPWPGFIGGSFTSQSPQAACERTVNFYVEDLETEGRTTRRALYPTPGVTLLDTAATAGGRGSFYQAGRCFVVIGTGLYEITYPSGVFTLTSRGTVAHTDGNPATIAANGDGGGELFITSGDNGYIYTLATDVLTTERTGATTMGAMLDGYFLALDAATSTLWISDLYDGTTWDPLQFAQRSIAPDQWKALITTSRSILLLGDETSEVWSNAGVFPFPFRPHPAGLMPVGICAPFSVVDIGGRVLWLSRTANGHGPVVQAEGYLPERISTHAVETAIDGYSRNSRVDDAIGDTYEDQGHSFYILTFPTANATWAYDLTTKTWAERGTWISEENTYDAWRPCHHVFAFNKHLMLDRETGGVYQMTPDVATDVDDRPIRRLRRSPAVWDENKRIFISAIELHVQPGVGLITGQGSDPQVAMRLSYDAGQTWGTERSRSAGAIGEYSQRVRWTRCGSGTRPVVEVVMTDPVPFRILGASLEARPSA